MSLYEDLPEDPEDAFLVLEADFRETCEMSILRSSEEVDERPYYENYVVQVMGAVVALQISDIFTPDPPNIGEVTYTEYRRFKTEVLYFTTKISIRRGRRIKGFSVQFNRVTKKKILHYLNKIEDIIEKIDLSHQKKEALINKLRSFQSELDRDRTRLEAYGNLMIDAAGVLGDTAEQLKPVKEILDSISRLIWGARQESNDKQLSPPEERKQIEPPQESPSEQDNNKSDDEIPF